jgi:hypothetical protein
MMMKNRSIVTLTFILLLLGGIGGAAFATNLVINVDFDDPANNASQHTYSGLAASPIGGSTWNSITASGGGASVDSNGVALPGGPITVTFSASGPIDLFTGVAVTPAEDLMREVIYNSLGAGAQPFALSNVPAGTYDLYIYSQNGQYKSAATQFDIGAASHTATNDGSATTFSEDTNYVRFRDITVGGGGVISGTFTALTAAQSSFNGFQLVQLPEPTSLGILAIAGAVFTMLRPRHAAA